MPSTTSFDSALTDLRQGNASYYSYGAVLSIPLGGNLLRPQHLQIRQGDAETDSAAIKQQEQNITGGRWTTTWARSAPPSQQVNATRDARIYAEDALAAERKKLENGKSTSFIVLQLISNLTTARVNEIQALANYNIAVAQLALDEGNTLDCQPH